MLKRIKQYCNTMIFKIPCIEEAIQEHFNEYRHSEYWEEEYNKASRLLAEKEAQLNLHRKEYVAYKSENTKLFENLNRKITEIEYLKGLLKVIKNLNDATTKAFSALQTENSNLKQEIDKIQKQKIEEQKLFKRITVGYILALLFSYGSLIAVGLQH